MELSRLDRARPVEENRASEAYEKQAINAHSRSSAAAGADSTECCSSPLELPTAARKRVFQAVSWRILPIYFAMICFCYIDRNNLAFASIQLKCDLGFSDLVYGLGSGIFFIGYSACQVPSSMMTTKAGAPRWLAFIIVTWGIMAVGTASISSVPGFFAVRFLLGAAESGAFPGMWWHLAQFYPDNRITSPYAVVESAITISQIVAAPLAALLLHMDGTAGLRGWQWLFIMEGVPSILIGVVILLALPEGPHALRRSLTATQREWLTAHMRSVRPSYAGASGTSPDNQQLLEMPQTDAPAPLPPPPPPPPPPPQKPGVGLESVLAALRNPSMWHMASVKFCKDLTAYGTLFWTPIFIHRLHDDEESEQRPAAPAPHGGEELDCSGTGVDGAGVRAVLLTAIPFGLAATFVVLNAVHSQRIGERRLHISVPYIIGGVTMMLLPLASLVHPALGLVCLTAAVVSSQGANAPLISLTSALVEGPSLAVSLAMFNSLGNVGGLLGPSLIGLSVQVAGSFTPAMVILGVALIAGGVLVLLVKDPADSGKAAAAVPCDSPSSARTRMCAAGEDLALYPGSPTWEEDVHRDV